MFLIAALGTFVAHARREPGTRLYTSWRYVERATEFLHLMEFENADAERAHATSDAVKVFTDTLYPMCTEPPVFDAWETVE